MSQENSKVEKGEEPVEEPEQQEQELVAIDISVTLPNGPSVSVSSFPVTENLLSLKQLLMGYYESCMYTCFTLEAVSVTQVDDSIVKLAAGETLDETMEIRQYVTETTKSLLLNLVPQPYDLKKVRMQLKTTQEIIQHAPNASGSSSSSFAAAAAASESSAAVATEKKEKDNKPLSTDGLARSEEFLSKFYQEALMRVGSVEHAERAAKHDKLLRETVKYISASGWNAPPKHRKLQGDLFYIEVVTANEGSLYITACRDGFYINKSNKNHFDASMHAKPHFTHELLLTVLSACTSVRAAWAQVKKNIDAAAEEQTRSRPMDGILSLFAQGRSEESVFKPSWCMPPAGDHFVSSSSASSSSGGGDYSYDMFRAEEKYADMFGVDELGAPREWIDEIRSVRALAPKDMSEKAYKAKFEYRVIFEFTEACKSAVSAIADGMIAPLSANDPLSAELYYYNNIFFSKAVDPGDDSKIFSGHAAHRRAALHDVINQKHIQSMGVDGISTVLSTIVDFKGSRFLCQTAVPGLLVAQPQNQPRLMYGALDKQSKLVVKNSSIEVMEKLVKNLFIPKRNLKQCLIGDGNETAVETAAAAAESTAEGAAEGPSSGGYAGMMASLEAQQVSAIRTDTEDDVEAQTSADGTAFVPHAGPFECKLLKGTDGVTYLLDVMRLTPRDANFVSKASGGTGLLATDLLDGADAELTKTYVIRQELVAMYIQRRLLQKRQEVYQAAIKGKVPDTEMSGLSISTADDEQAVPSTAASGATLTSPGEGTPVVVKASEDGDWTVVKDPSSSALSPTAGSSSAAVADKPVDTAAAPVAVKADEKSKLSAGELEKLQEEIASITIESLGISMNPNCLFGFPSDIDAEVAKRDEESARSIATFLWEEVLPALTRHIREKLYTPRDAAAAVNTMHQNGINVRYLGVLAKLAEKEEQEDMELMREGKQRIHGMPLYWREQMTIEALARSVKHTLNQYMQDDAEVAAAPAATIASVLNHLFETIALDPKEAQAAAAKAMGIASGDVNEAANAFMENGTGAATAAAASTTVSKSSKKIKKKKNNAAAAAADSTTPDADASSTAPSSSSNSSERLACLKTISGYMRSRFFYDFPLDNMSVEQKIFIGARIHAPTLLRRICQQCGVRVQMKDYQFARSVGEGGGGGGAVTTSPFPAQGIFRASDVLSLDPITKSCEPKVLMSEINDIISTSVAFMKEDQHGLAYQYASEACSLVENIAGPVHSAAVKANHQLMNVFSTTGDFANALLLAEKNLALCVQVHGLDSVESVDYHMQCAELCSELDRITDASQHLFAAKYLVTLLGGENHPDLGNLFYVMADLYRKSGMVESQLRCLQMARQYFSSDLVSHASLSQAIAEVYAGLGLFQEAQHEQTGSYKVMKALYGDSDPRTSAAKDTLEKYMRGSSALQAKLRKLKEQFGDDTEGLTAAAKKLLPAISGFDNESLTASASSSDAAHAGGGGGGKKKKKKSGANKK